MLRAEGKIEPPGAIEAKFILNLPLRLHFPYPCEPTYQHQNTQDSNTQLCETLGYLAIETWAKR